MPKNESATEWKKDTVRLDICSNCDNALVNNDTELQCETNLI